MIKPAVPSSNQSSTATGAVSQIAGWTEAGEAKFKQLLNARYLDGQVTLLALVPHVKDGAVNRTMTVMSAA